METIRQHHISLKNAFSGIWWALRTQPNFKIHLTLSILAVFLGVIFKLTLPEWVILIFTIFWGLATEMLNTSIEAITDLVTQEWRQEAKIAKDVSAGMMLVVALGALCIGFILFVPKIWHLIIT